jgi:hypothetical protein
MTAYGKEGISKPGFSQHDAKRSGHAGRRVVHRIDNLKIHLYKVPDLLITGDGKSFPGVSEGAIIIVALGRGPSRVERGPRITCE